MLTMLAGAFAKKKKTVPKKASDEARVTVKVTKLPAAGKGKGKAKPRVHHGGDCGNESSWFTPTSSPGFASGLPYPESSDGTPSNCVLSAASATVGSGIDVMAYGAATLGGAARKKRKVKRVGAKKKRAVKRVGGKKKKTAAAAKKRKVPKKVGPSKYKLTKQKVAVLKEGKYTEKSVYRHVETGELYVRTMIKSGRTRTARFKKVVY